MGILLSIARFLSCFISCFRGRDDRRREEPLISDDSSINGREEDWRKDNNLASVFVSEGKQVSSDNTTYKYDGSHSADNIDKELKDEAKFLKACGTILETPAEIRNVSQELEYLPSYGGDSEHSNFHSIPPTSPINKLKWEEQPDQLPSTKAKDFEAVGKKSDPGSMANSCRDDRRCEGSLISNDSSTNGREDDWTKDNNLASMFMSEGKQVSSDTTTYQNDGSPFLDSIDKELKDEELEYSPSYNGDFEPPNFQLIPPTSPINKLNWEEQPDQLPGTEAKDFELVGKKSDPGSMANRDDQRHEEPLISDDSSVNGREEDWTKENNLASVFVSEGEHVSSDNTTYRNDGSHFSDSIDKELKDEAEFLKACGMLETPAEIRNASQELEYSPSYDGDYEPPNFHFIPPTSPINKLNWEEQPCQLPGTEAIDFEAVEKESDLGSIANSFMSKEQEAAGRESCEVQIPYSPTGSIHPIDDDISAVTPQLPSVSTRKTKSVRFNVQPDKEPFSSKSCLPKTGAKILDLSDSSGSDNGSTKSCFATPLVISDDMQTPGTIYPSNQKTFVSGKDGRIRFQYVRPVLKPLDNLSHWETLRKEGHSNQKQMGEIMQSFMQNENAYPNHTSVSRAVFGGRLHSRTADMDRPIIGVVAQHWNFNEPSHIPDKFAIGNGIPNSTRKYKEDQKVSWHATPFEERLEKALSEDTLIVKRKVLDGRPIDFDENEECFTG